MADVHLPGTLIPLFAGLTAPARRRRGNGRRGDRGARAAVAGTARPAVRAGPSLRTHIHVYVDRERAALDTRLEPRSRVDVIAAISGG